MRKYIVEVSRTAENDIENIILYIRNELAGDIVADKYKIMFKQELLNLESIAGTMPVIDKELTGYANIRKINVRNYIIFYLFFQKLHLKNTLYFHLYHLILFVIFLLNHFCFLL